MLLRGLARAGTLLSCFGRRRLDSEDGRQSLTASNSPFQMDSDAAAIVHHNRRNVSALAVLAIEAAAKDEWATLIAVSKHLPCTTLLPLPESQSAHAESVSLLRVALSGAPASVCIELLRTSKADWHSAEALMCAALTVEREDEDVAAAVAQRQLERGGNLKVVHEMLLAATRKCNTGVLDAITLPAVRCIRRCHTTALDVAVAAAVNGCVPVLRVLFSEGALNENDRLYFSLIVAEHAALFGHRDVLVYLHSSTTRITRIGILALGCMRGLPLVVEESLPYFVDRWRAKLHALDIAAQHGHSDVVRVLVRALPLSDVHVAMLHIPSAQTAETALLSMHPTDVLVIALSLGIGRRDMILRVLAAERELSAEELETVRAAVGSQHADSYTFNMREAGETPTSSASANLLAAPRTPNSPSTALRPRAHTV